MQSVECLDLFDFCPLQLKKARLEQCVEICDLINLTYRGEFGWSRETHIIEGNRTSEHEIASAITNPVAHFFVVIQRERLISCIYVAREDDCAYIGFFSVHPDFQAKGMGKQVLKQAELFALTQLNIQKYRMYVVSQRSELIAFYERRGYDRTGKIEAYPCHLGAGIPRINGLTIEYLEKHA